MIRPPSVPTEILLSAARQGDTEAWAGIMQRYRGLLRSIAGRYGLSGPDADDLAQTTWLRLVEHAHAVRQPERLASWLAVTARHEALRILRRAGRELPVGLSTELETDQSGHVPADAQLLRGVLASEIREAVSELPPRCQRLLQLLTEEPKKSYQEISQTLDMPVGSIGPTRARCLACLRRSRDQLVA